MVRRRRAVVSVRVIDWVAASAVCVVVVGLSEVADQAGVGSEYERILRRKYICVSGSNEILGIPDRKKPGGNNAGGRRVYLWI